MAIAVAPASSVARIETEADEVVCLRAPEDFYAVGQFFDDFGEVTDDIAVAALARPTVAMEVRSSALAAECRLFEPALWVRL